MQLVSSEYYFNWKNENIAYTIKEENDATLIILRSNLRGEALHWSEFKIIASLKGQHAEYLRKLKGYFHCLDYFKITLD